MGLAALAVTAAEAVFLWGPLAEPQVLAAVLGPVPPLVPARLEGATILGDGEAEMPRLVPQTGAAAEGALATLDGAGIARLRFYCAGVAPLWQMAEVVTADARVLCRLPATEIAADANRQSPVWDATAWRQRWAATVVSTAGDVMALFGQAEAADVARRRHAMLVRGASRVRAAAEAAPTQRRRRAQAQDVTVAAQRQPYAAFFAVAEYDLTHRRFDGTTSAPMTRAVFLSGDAVTVLPYDPVRDRVLLIEQLRAGPIGRGDPQPWQLEAIAGRIDPGETAETAARREALEEARLVLGPFRHVADYYPSPGAKAEWLSSFVALTDLPDGSARPGGLADEQEDIRAHLLPWAEVEALLASGEINNAPLLITLLWLQRERPALRA
jgi:nudix-type nucleoside diphosphatase (YffH/AdpP family)